MIRHLKPSNETEENCIVQDTAQDVHQRKKKERRAQIILPKAPRDTAKKEEAAPLTDMVKDMEEMHALYDFIYLQRQCF